MEEQKNQWWYNAYDKIADKIKIAADSDDEGAKKKSSKKKSSKKKRKRDEESVNADAAGDASAAREKKFRIPTDEELFAATGGKLFGRRAYGSCNGKLKRDELLQSGKFELKDKKKKETKDSTSSSGDDDEEESKKQKKKDKKEKKKLAKAAKTQQQAKDDGSSAELD